MALRSDTARVVRAEGELEVAAEAVRAGAHRAEQVAVGVHGDDVQEPGDLRAQGIEVVIGAPDLLRLERNGFLYDFDSGTVMDRSS